jgi:hypothetical protein
MQVRFKCECGARLRCSLRGIGRNLRCPGCSAVVPVPSPEPAEVQRALKEIPFALPGKSSSEYLSLAHRIYNNTKFNVDVCKMTRHRDLAFESIEQAKRTLHNIGVFIEDSDRNSVSSNDPAATSIADALSSVAAGHNFAGIGPAAERARDHKIWQGIQDTSPTDLTRTQHPLRGQILEVLAAVKSLIPLV